ncbi:MAG: isocitrate/isopropylmalate dehydrogenase family protein [Myxococcota bacterium]
MPHHITLIPGDGIGPEVAQATVRVLEATGVHIQWDEQPAGLVAFERCGEALPESTIASVRRNKVALKGPTSTPVGGGHVSANVRLRKGLDLYASVRPVRSVPGVKSRYDNIDLVVFRENTEGLYAGLENEVSAGVIVSIKVVTKGASLRIARSAFEFARKHGRKKVTVVHKANILKKGDGFFLSCCREVASEYPEIAFEDAIIDACCMKLVTNPQQFDVLLMENLYGDIVSDLCAGLVGGLGVVPGSNLGEQGAIFEAVHGSAPDIAGKGLANPTALMKSAVLMLEHLGELSAAERLGSAINKVIEEGIHTTRDLGGTAGTDEFTEAVIQAL